MNSSPKVLSVVWNLIRGGTEGQCARVAILMAGRGATHRVAAFRREGFFLPQVERICGPVHHVDIRAMLSLSTMREVRALAAYVRREGIDVLHAWDCDAAIFGSVAARLAGVPLITSHRDLGEIYSSRKLWLMQRADAVAAAVVVNAGTIGDRFRIPSAKILCVTNILDVNEFDKRAAETCPADTVLPPGRRVAMVARLDPEKDVETVLRAARIVCDKHEDVSFVLAGDGRERAQLEVLVGEYGLARRVVFLGEVDYVPALLRRCCIGVLAPRANEGLSNTILEYMAGSLPAVVTDCGGNRELVRDRTTGFVVRVGDAQALAEAILTLLADTPSAIAMGRAGREIVSREHRPDAVADVFDALYRRVASAR